MAQPTRRLHSAAEWLAQKQYKKDHPPLKPFEKAPPPPPPPKFQLADACALAAPACVKCRGTGQTRTDRTVRHCHCVYRRAFRYCLRAYHEAEAGYASWAPRREGAGMYGFKSAEYAADFILVARRTLSPAELRIFNRHFLDGMRWTHCGMGRGAFFHLVYDLEQRLGRAYLELKPYSLYPPAYFAGRNYRHQNFPESTTANLIRGIGFIPERFNLSLAA